MIACSVPAGPTGTEGPLSPPNPSTHNRPPDFRAGAAIVPIKVSCSACGAKLNAKDSLAGKRIKCPSCGTPVQIPDPGAEEVYDAEEVGDGGEFDFGGIDPDAGEQVEDRKPCPACGEMIMRSAVKCRYCGEVFDTTLKRDRRVRRRSGRAGIADEELRSIAIYQKGIIVCILVYLASVAVSLGVPEQIRPILALPMLCAAIGGFVFVLLAAMKVYNTGVGILLGLLTLIPCIGLLILLLVNAKATAVLRENDVPVGFFGARLSDL